jgi:peptide/nickel transport system substrate-binding protein
VLLPEGVGLEAAIEIQRRWAGTANQVRFDLEGGLRIVDSQYRPEVARPANGLINRTVRQALYHAIDRKSFGDAIMQGMAPMADSWIPPSDARRPALEATIPQFPFDLNRAQQLLVEAGWVRGTDGTLVHTQSGERFETQIWADQENEAIREMNIIADFWKAVGVQAAIQPIPPSRLGDREYLASYPGALLSGPPANRLHEDRYHSRSISSAATRWAGTNRFGYSNPRVDLLLDQLSTTLSAQERVGIHQQLLGEMLGDVAVMPLYWEILPVVVLAGIKTNKVADNTATWDFIRWDRE